MLSSVARTKSNKKRRKRKEFSNGIRVDGVVKVVFDGLIVLFVFDVVVITRVE